ncbi:MAG: methylenetetrahydrofolate reductase [NAD(P)H], partial [Flavobacterium sp.]
DPLMEFKPPFIDVTSLREDYIFKEHQNGLLEKLSYRKRPGTIAICAAIMNKYKVDTVPHLLCGGFTKGETENALIDLQFLGIENVLVLRGDARRGDASFVPTPGGHCYATDLLQQVVDMNNGKYLKQKIDMGAKFIVTQMFFDNQKYFDFVNGCRANGIDVPIIPGLKPITNSKQLVSLSKTFFIDMPEDLCDAVHACKDEKAVREAGIEWMINQCKELVAFGAPVLHFYTMSNAGPTKRIAEAIF